MSDIENKRTYLAGLYGGTRRWRRAVARMSDNQVIAIWLKEQQKQKVKSEPKPPHHNEDEFSTY